ncbi:MAG: rod shape-determining protein MreD [Rickettsiales bacterium]|nr:rod shape-determining protein MreD [Rickettsiales bacterium]|tara:strand:- start:563 stop:1060 length:498 start_codon:yes stop_codon:yes gene_type:complete
MINSFFLKLFPFIFIFFFIYFEFSPVYFFEKKLIKPFLAFSVVYCWICNDIQKFRPLWLLIFGLFYDFLQDGMVGITSLFFLFIYNLQRKQSGNLLSYDFKETWIRFALLLFFYVICCYLINSLIENYDYDLKKNSISFVLTVLLFPLFFIFVEKITYKFRSYDE